MAVDPVWTVNNLPASPPTGSGISQAVWNGLGPSTKLAILQGRVVPTSSGVVITPSDDPTAHIFTPTPIFTSSPSAGSVRTAESVASGYTPNYTSSTQNPSAVLPSDTSISKAPVSIPPGEGAGSSSIQTWGILAIVVIVALLMAR